MSTGANRVPRSVVPAIDDVLREIERAGRSDWRFADGSSMQSQLDALRTTMEEIRAEASAGVLLQRNRLLSILRWVIDWVPDPEGPLVQAVSRVDDTLA